MILDNGVLRFTGNGILSDDPMDPWIVPRSCHCSPILCLFSTLHTHTEDGNRSPLTLSSIVRPHQVTTMVSEDDDDNYETSTRDRRPRPGDATDLWGWSAGVGAAHYFPRSARTNWKSIRGREAVATAASVHTSRRRARRRCRCVAAGAAAATTDAPLLVVVVVVVLVPLLVVARETAGWARSGGRVGGGRGEERPGAEQRRKTKVAEGATRSDRDGASWSSSFRVRVRSYPSRWSLQNSPSSSHAARASLLAFPARVACVQALTKLGGNTLRSGQLAPGDSSARNYADFCCQLIVSLRSLFFFLSLPLYPALSFDLYMYMYIYKLDWWCTEWEDRSRMVEEGWSNLTGNPRWCRVIMG